MAEYAEGDGMQAAFDRVAGVPAVPPRQWQDAYGIAMVRYVLQIKPAPTCIWQQLHWLAVVARPAEVQMLDPSARRCP